MEKENRLKLYKEAVELWGVNAQVDMVFEECGELVAVLAKDRRGRAEVQDILTELADVSIMCEQIGALLGYEDFEAEKERKLERLKKRLEESKRERNGKGA